MGCVRIVAFAAAGLGLGLMPRPGLAQSVDIPLSYAVNTGANYGFSSSNPALVLTINVGVNGGAAQTYAFDTGSSVFLAPSSVYAGGASTVLATGVNVETYGTSPTSAFTGDLYQISASSLKFYATAGATSGGIALGTTGNYNVASYTSYSLSTGGATSAQPFGASVGVFGASALAFNKTVAGTGIGLGSVIGQTNVTNTAPGYMVAANGQSLAALNGQLNTSISGGPVTSALQSIQAVPQSITSCNPCVTVGLTPALIAQFLPVNTVDAGSNGVSFANSNVLSMGKFVPLNFGLGFRAPFSQNVSLDTGWTDFAVPRGRGSVPTLTISASRNGTQEMFNIASAPGVPSPYALANSSADILGIGFFVQNSVLYNLAGQQVGFSSNFVTDANIAMTQPLVVDASSVPLGLAGIISGPGGLSIQAGGSATLSGTNTYTGATNVSGNSAYLALVGPGSIAASSGVNVSASGWFDVSGASTIAMIKSLSGDADGVVWLGANALALSAASGVFTGTMIGSGGFALISGQETLSGINGYTGMTVVSGGTLTVNGSIANSFLTVVGPGGTLAGTGTVGLLNVLDGGTFAPAWGTPGRTMNVAGDLILSSGANYAVQLAASRAAFADVSGNATLGGTVVASAAPGSAILRQYDLLHSGSINGTSFGGITSLPGFSATLSYSATDAYLTLDAALVAQAQASGVGANGQRIAKLLDASFNSTGTMSAGFSPPYTLTGRNLGNALTQISGEAGTGIQQTSFNAMDQFLGLLMDAGVGEQGGARWSATSASNFAGTDDEFAYAATSHARRANERDAYGLMAKAPLRTNYDQRWSVWASGFGGSQSSDGNAAAGLNAVTNQVFGTAVGADYLLSPRTVMGFALAGGGTSAGVANSGTARSDLFQAGAFVRHRSGAAYVAAGLDYGWQDITTERTVTVSGVDRLRAEFRANAWSGRVEGGYRLAVPSMKGFGLTPYAAAQFTSVALPAYAESAVSGAGTFALSYSGRNVTDSRSEIGVRTDQTFAIRNSLLLTVDGRLAWAHDFDPDRWAAASFLALPASGFTVNGAAQGRDAALTSLGADFNWLNGWSARAVFEGAFSDVSRSYAGKGLLRYTW